MLAFRPLQRYFDFAGRSGRAEYWQWIVLTTLANVVAKIMDRASSDSYGPPSHIVVFLLFIATVIPGLSVSWRRLHDINQPGIIYGIVFAALLIEALVMLAGLFLQQSTGSSFLFDIGILGGLAWFAIAIYMIYLFALPGDAGSNSYGPPDAFAASAPPLGTYLDRFAAPPAASRPSGTDATMDALERLGRLHAEGHLSDEELAAQKRRLLGMEDARPPL